MKQNYSYLNQTLLTHQDEYTFHFDPQFFQDNQVDSTSVALSFFQPSILPPAENLDSMIGEFIQEDYCPPNFKQEGFSSMFDPVMSIMHPSSFHISNLQLLALDEQAPPVFQIPLLDNVIEQSFSTSGTNSPAQTVDEHPTCPSSDEKSELPSDESRIGSPSSNCSSPGKPKSSLYRVEKKTKLNESTKNKFSLLFTKAEKVDLGVFLMTKCPCCPKLFKALRGFKGHISKEHPSYL
ncbi:hypothetical protein HDV06_007058 [Boothiomyces sp. JEL0866]|nr:hypothetical protein HDV06_007058 [Boothiomyces sp. JEL0866]